MIHRRAFVTGMAAVLTVPSPRSAAQPQPATKQFRVVELNPIPPTIDRTQAVPKGPGEALRQAFADLGYVHGANMVLEERFAAGSEQRLRDYAAEAVRINADVILAVSSSAVRAAVKATRTIPIVALDLESDPVASGFVATLARPGGNLTGFFLDLPELSGKRLELLREALPGITRVAFLWDPSMDPAPRRAAESAGRRLGLSLQIVEARDISSLEGAFRGAMTGGSRAMMLHESPLISTQPKLVADLTIQHRLPTVGIFSYFTAAGMLMSYGPNINDLFRRAASYIDRILKGNRPGDLAVQRPSTFELAINLKTAKTLGLTIPPSLLLRADQVIE